ncbi:TPA: glycosyltransferase family 4 protein, partial [Streptococcus pneumoniae]|nr:glycosyltransferase family 4 protein [Streptococcus pneumoniae]HEV0448889.1 glycosyltransferase family 4 protein [Streptococcus pneumoniae]
SLRHLDIVTAPSAFTLNNFINKGFINPSSQKCMVIENAVIFSKGKLENIIKQKQETKRNPEKTNFLFVGSILEIKGVFNLVKAFKKLTSPEISLKIVGKGKDLEKLQKEIESDPRIQYLGFQDTETLYKTYQNSDVLVVPSAWDEPFGRVVIEGNANGLPVITSDRGGLPEIVQTVGGGEIFTDESGNTLYSLLKKFVEMENYNVYYQCILENIDIYSIEKQSEKFTNLYLDKEIE